MNYLELIFTVCVIGNATVCEDKISRSINVRTCATCAMPRNSPMGKGKSGLDDRPLE